MFFEDNPERKNCPVCGKKNKFFLLRWYWTDYDCCGVSRHRERDEWMIGDAGPYFSKEEFERALKLKAFE